MIEPSVEETLERLYVYETEGGAYPQDLAGLNETGSLGLVQLREGRYKLTERGLKAGCDVIRRHRLAECLLKDVLEVSPERLEEDACSFEHVIKNGLDDKVCTLLGHPLTCPHGKPIPEGECCRLARTHRIEEIRPLCEGKPGEHGTIVYLTTRDTREIRKMMAMGILPGVRIQVIRRFPTHVFQVGFSQFAVDRRLAEKVYVRWDRAG